jgi:hypothetical protein
MTEADVIFGETEAIIETGDEEKMRDFRNVLDEAVGEIDNALYEIAAVYKGDDA